MIRAWLLVLTASAALTLSTGPAHATLYTYNYVGTVIGLAEEYDFYNFERGDQINVSFTLDIGSQSPLADFTIGGRNYGPGAPFQDLLVCAPCTTNTDKLIYSLQVTAAGPQAGQTEINFRGGDWRSFLDFPDVLDPTLFFEGAVFEHHINFDSFYVAVNLDRIAPVESVPEPGTLALLGSGLLGFTFWRRGRVR